MQINTTTVQYIVIIGAITNSTKNIMSQQYKCDMCQQAYENVLSYVTHVGLHSNEKGYNLVCKIRQCPLKFFKHKSFRKHYERKHKSEIEYMYEELSNECTETETTANNITSDTIQISSNRHLP